MNYKQKSVFAYILMIFIFFVLLYIVSYNHYQELTNDGFKIIKKYDSYILVEKDNHLFMATEVGMYGLDWNYEHYPNCPCFKTK